MENIQIAEPIINQKIIDRVNKILMSKQLTQGANLTLLESKVEDITNSKYCVAVSSGTAALHTILSSFNFNKNNEVITSPFSFVATVNSIILAGAKPVFSDIDNYFNLDPDAVEDKINKNTKAIVAVDLFGQLSNYSRLSAIAKKYKLKLISDSAQSIGALHNNKSVTSYVNAACISLYGSKNIASGEGGLIITNDRDLFEFSQLYRNQGQDKSQKYFYKIPGLNYRMTEFSAAIAFEQIKILNKIIKKRKKIYDYYSSNLENITQISIPEIMSLNKSVYHQYSILINKKSKYSRDDVRDLYSKNSIETEIYYPVPLHLIKHLKYLGYKKDDFPKTEDMCNRIISLPFHYYLTKKEMIRVITVLKDVYK